MSFLKFMGAGIVGVCVAFGMGRLLRESQDVRKITSQRIEVSETYGISNTNGFLGDTARFDWNQGERARLMYGDKTILLRTPCDHNDPISYFGDGSVAPEQAKGALEEACEVLDCDEICSEWKRVSYNL